MGGTMSEELQSLIERYNRSGDSRLFAPLADAYRKQGDPAKAIEILEKGLERFPEYASGHVILGKCFYDTGATERAKAEFRRVLELDAENMVALKFLGDIMLAEDRRAEAAECYRRLLAIDPKNEDAARSLKESQPSFAVKEIDLADDAIARDERPRDLATMTLAGIYAAQGYYNKALAIYRDVLAREPANREAKDMIAKLEGKLGSSATPGGEEGEEPILSISLDDVGEDLAANTVGRGGSEASVRAELPREAAGAPAVPAAETPDAPSTEKPAAPPGETAAPETILGAGKEAPGAADAEPVKGEAPNETPADDMEQFREWLKKVRGR